MGVGFALLQQSLEKLRCSKGKRVLCITNYRKDKQFSMQKFSKILLDNSNKARDLNIEEIFPKPLLGNIISFSKLAKWAAYIDKYLIFPKRLKSTLEKSNQNLYLTHIIDHSNAIYLRTIRKASTIKCLLTCHDLIAVRTALGEFPLHLKLHRLVKDYKVGSRIRYHLPISTPVILKKPKRTSIVSFLYHQNPPGYSSGNGK